MENILILRNWLLCKFCLIYAISVFFTISCSSQDKKNELKKIIKEEIAVKNEQIVPVSLCDVAPGAGMKIFYYYKETIHGAVVLKMHFPQNWRKDSSLPCAVFFHGGVWRSGELNKVPSQFEPFCDHLATRGLVTVNVQYRGVDQTGNHAEYCVEDAKSSIRWLRKHANEFGIDPDKMIVGGGSAGGHLAVATFTTPGFDSETDELQISPKPNLFLLLNPVLNANRKVEKFASQEACNACSPLLNMSNSMPPALIMFGTEDEIIKDGQQYIEEAKKLGLKAELWIADGQKHAFFNRQPWRNSTIYRMELFLEKYGFIKEAPTISFETYAEMKLLSEAK